MATNGHARPTASASGHSVAEPGAVEYLVIVHPAGDLDAPHLARYWTEVPALSACTADGHTVDQAVENTRHAIARWLTERSGADAGGASRPFRLSVQLAF